jgi:hypothetical protein
VGIASKVRRTALTKAKLALGKKWPAALVVAGIVVTLAAAILWLPRNSGNLTGSARTQPEYAYKAAGGYSYVVSFSNVVLDRVNAKPGQVNVTAEFTVRNTTEGHKAPLPSPSDAQIIALDTSAHPECAYSKFKANPGACDLEGMTLKTRVGMYYNCARADLGYIGPGESVTCAQVLQPVDEARYKQLGENGLRNMFVGYFGAKNSRIDKNRCVYAFYGTDEPGAYAETRQCEPDYVMQPGDAKLGDESYASDWHALNSRW